MIIIAVALIALERLNYFEALRVGLLLLCTLRFQGLLNDRYLTFINNEA